MSVPLDSTKYEWLELNFTKEAQVKVESDWCGLRLKMTDLNQLTAHTTELVPSEISLTTMRWSDQTPELSYLQPWDLHMF